MSRLGHRASTKRRIAVVTGTRAEYGLLCSPMEAIRRHPRLELQLIVTGMHLLKTCGTTVRDIERDGWHVDARVPMQRGHDDALDQAQGLARGVMGIAKFLDQARSDIVLVLGDRIEALAGALAAVTTGRYLAHVHGGDVAPGDIDDALRHAITKLAHIHLVASSDAARRVVRMGESPHRVHVVGAPGMDRLFELLRESPRTRDRSRALIVQHAYGRRPEREYRTMRSLLQAVVGLRLAGTIIHPNTDRGHSGVTRAIHEFAAQRNGRAPLHIVHSMPRDDYLRTLIASAVLVGNSSSGIIEAAAAGVPAVNVGDRQSGRLRASRSVIDSGETTREIRQAIMAALALRPKTPRATPYGDGHAGERIADILARTLLTEELRRKRNNPQLSRLAP